jgi:hypothetical protein
MVKWKKNPRRFKGISYRSLPGKTAVIDISGAFFGGREGCCAARST